MNVGVAGGGGGVQGGGEGGKLSGFENGGTKGGVLKVRSGRGGRKRVEGRG